MSKQDSITWLRDNGYAVIIWNPDELRGVNPTKLEDRSIELGWEVINDLGQFYKDNEDE